MFHGCTVFFLFFLRGSTETLNSWSAGSVHPHNHGAFAHVAADGELAIRRKLMRSSKADARLDQVAERHFGSASSVPYANYGPATCRGSQLKCPQDGSDPCSQVDGCNAAYHKCPINGLEEGYKNCAPHPQDNTTCRSTATCYLKCSGVHAEKKAHGPGKPRCEDLGDDTCNGHYVVDLQVEENGLGYECQLSGDSTCTRAKTCGAQNPPESLGRPQCEAPEVLHQADAGACQESSRVNPGHVCTAQCQEGYTPSETSLSCNKAGRFDPTTFKCNPNPCVAPEDVENAPDQTCEEVGEIQSGSQCTAQCDDGYHPSVARLLCRAEVLIPATYECLKPCTPPAVQFAANGGLCQEGDTILPGEECHFQCASGYSPSKLKAECKNGQLTPGDIRCVPKACAAPKVLDQAFSGACEEGTTIQSTASGAKKKDFSYCTAQCKPGYAPSVAKLKCYAEALEPETFTCDPLPCDAPQVKHTVKTGACREGTSIDSGSVCTARCKTGYTASVKTLRCSATVLEPATFACEPNPCAAPSNVANALGSGACEEGRKIGHGSDCTAQCAEGYSPSAASMSCSLGQFTPKSFTCDPKPCSPPEILNAHGDGSCQEGDSVASGASCTPRCAERYAPDRGLQCRLGVFSPEAFSCVPKPCPAPKVKHSAAEGACKEGSSVKHGGKCTAQCLAGYTPTHDVLPCSAEWLTPQTFKCLPNPCEVSDSINHVSDSGPCVEATTSEGKTLVAHGGRCSTQCMAGFQPNAAKLTCAAGVLSPANFQCLPQPCQAPEVRNRQGSGCLEGESVVSGQSCTAQCRRGYRPSVKALECRAQVFSPASFECIPEPCQAPSDVENAKLAHGSPQPCEEGFGAIAAGASCTAQCQPGYAPSALSLLCHAGVLSPATFTCAAKSCPTPRGIANVDSEGACQEVVEEDTEWELKCFDHYDKKMGCRWMVHEVRLFGNSDCTGLALAADLEAFPAATSAEHGIDKAFDHDIRSGWHSECPEHPDPSKYFIKFKANAGLKCIKVSQSSTAGCKTIKVFKNQTEVSATGGLLRLHLVPEVVFEERKTWELKCLKHFDEANDGKGCRWQVNEVEAFYNGECTHAAPVASISGKPKDGDINKAFDADLGTKWTPSCAELPNQYAISFQASADLQCIKISQVPNVGCRTISVVRDGVEVARMRGLMKTKEPEPVLKIFKVALATGAKASHHFVKYGGQQCSGTGIGGISGQPGDAVSCLSKCLDTPSCVAFVIVHTGKHAGKCFFRSDLQLAVGAEEYTGDKRDCYIRQKVFAGAAAVMAIPSSGVCTTQCAPGYGPSVPSLSCSVGSLQPADFECKPEPCKAPEVANAASSGSCKEGANVLSGSTCTPQCSEGYLPSLDSLACHAGSLTPATFVCSGPCTPPTASKLLSYSCRELEDDPTGKIPHGSACTPICELGYVPAPSTLNCNNGNFDQAVKCQHDKPAEAKGQQIQFGWSGDPHYRGFNVRGRGGDAVYPGCHWVLKMECPNIPNWIWVQGLYGPRKPAVTMGMGFGGHFLRKNVLTIQAAREDAKCWNVRWNGMDVTDPKSGWKQDKAQANSYEFDLDGGTGADDNMIDVNWPSCNSVSAGLGYGLKYSASRNSWDREDNIGVSGQFYQDKYANQNLESFFCLNGKVEGESRTLDGETGGTGQLFVPVELDFFATPQTAIAAKLEELSEPAEMKKRHNQPTASPRGTKLTMGLLEDQELGLSEDGTMITTRTGTTTALQCTGEVLKKAHESCDALAKDKQEGEDDHDNDVKKAMLQSCIYDVCVTALKGFGKTYKEDEELYDEESALRHRMNFTMVGQGKACEEGHKKTTEVNDITLSEREKERLAAAKGNCTGPCEICMPGVRKYLVGSTVRHNETLQSCEAQRLAMPKTEADQKRLHTQQKKRSQTAKGWLGGHFHDGGWQWDDDTELKDTFVEDGQEGDYLCMDRGSGSLVNCNHNNGTLHDGLCEVQFHYPGMDEPVEEEVMTG